ncbi:MAG: type I-C CRISPR-associated protein Cas8c/Csd1 [Clostridiales bacterium]|nr:type I-C CRISPR-associated protein Cas8c/Csd1 [Clostridiales bacterium]
MLIKALSEYYDILANAGKVLPDGYSNVNVHYLICLTPDGRIDEIIDYRQIEEETNGKGKVKQKKVPQKCVMPQRTEKPGIDVNIPEHRPLYIFGLNLTGDQLTPEDSKTKKSHKAFVKISLDFLDGIDDADSPLIHAYRCFIQNWDPEAETENPNLKQLGKDYGKSGYAFCLSGSPDRLLHDEPALKEKWEQLRSESTLNGDGAHISQCAVSGQQAPIARIHNKVRGVFGGLATGTVLIGFNNPSENSYGNEQAYNSNVSETVMKKYTEALNYLLDGRKHKTTLDDMTIVFWAMDPNEKCEDLFMQMFLGQSDKMNAEETENMLRALWKDASSGRIAEERLLSADQINPDVDFYMLGLKPNSGRLSMKFLIRKQFADILWNVAQFQKDMQVGNDFRPVYLWEIKRELISPKSSKDKVNPALLTKLFESVIYGSPFPTALLDTMVRRVKTDDVRVNATRTGVIKACINRNDSKEELKVSLDKENENQAYLCGRLFAVLEKLQTDASGGKLNRTIKDAYFASAASKPALVFPKLIVLSQNHLKKVKYPVVYNKQIQEITDKLQGGFPDMLLLKDQGKFIVGYYQQYQSFFTTVNNTNEMEEN